MIGKVVIIDALVVGRVPVYADETGVCAIAIDENRRLSTNSSEPFHFMLFHHALVIYDGLK